MAKKKYLIDGTSLTRSTDRTYTHAVIGISTIDGKIRYTGYCGRLDLAQKLANSADLARSYHNCKFEIREVHEVIKEKRDQ